MSDIHAHYARLSLGGGKWYKQGYRDALDGFCDPPWNPGHRDYRSYMEGHVDGERELEFRADHERERDSDD